MQCTLNSFSTFGLSAPLLEEEDAEIVTKLYCYTVLPGFEGVFDYGDPNIDWNGMGVGTIDLDPWKYEPGTTIPLDSVSYTLPASYPDITYDGHTLTYDDSENPKEYTYSITWTQIVISQGANKGHNGYNPEVWYWHRTVHLNGYVHLNLPHKCTVIFEIQEPGESGFSTASKDSYEVEQGTSLKSIIPQTEEEKVHDDKVYVFDGWFTNSQCTDPVDLDTVIEKDETYYARYIPKGTKILSITKNVVNGNTAMTDHAYHFRLQIFKENVLYSGPVEVVDSPDGPEILYPDESGYYTFTLKNGESILFGIGKGDTYIAEETEIPEGCTTAVSVDGQGQEKTALASGVMDEHASVVFTNYYQPVPPTGAAENTDFAWAAIWLAAACLSVLLFAVHMGRKEPHQ